MLKKKLDTITDSYERTYTTNCSTKVQYYSTYLCDVYEVCLQDFEYVIPLGCLFLVDYHSSTYTVLLQS